MGWELRKFGFLTCQGCGDKLERRKDTAVVQMLSINGFKIKTKIYMLCKICGKRVEEEIESLKKRVK